MTSKPITILCDTRNDRKAMLRVNHSLKPLEKADAEKQHFETDKLARSSNPAMRKRALDGKSVMQRKLCEVCNNAVFSRAMAWRSRVVPSVTEYLALQERYECNRMELQRDKRAVGSPSRICRGAHMKRNPISLPAVYFAPSLAVEWHRHLLHWACALLGAFYKRRPTSKPGLDCCALDRAEICAGIANKFPLSFRWHTVGQPMEHRWSTTVRVPLCHCTARCVPSTSCSRAALHVAPHALRQWQARRASRWGRSLPTGDAGKHPKTCPAQNQKVFAIKAKRGKTETFPAIGAFRWLRDSSFSRANLAPVIHEKTFAPA